MDVQVLNCIKTYYRTLKESLYSTYSQFINDDIVIWGTGEFGLKLFKLLVDFELAQNVKAFCSSDVNGERNILELPILSVKEAKKNFPNAVFIIASNFFKEILESGLCEGLNVFVHGVTSPLLYSEESVFSFHKSFEKRQQCGFNVNWFNFYFQEKDIKEKTCRVLDLLEDKKSKDILSKRMNFMKTGNVEFLRQIEIDKVTFFSNEYLNINHDEVYVDCGAFNGDTVISFNDFVQSKYKKIIAFEPSKEIYKNLKENIEKYSIKNVVTVNAANGSSNIVMSFLNLENEASRVISNKQLEEIPDKNKSKVINISIEKLDNYFNEKPSFIKMDIEGYELEALKGAEKILRELKPKLAVCIYHKEMDFYEIPMYLKSIVPEYKFKIRQHYDALYDTVLYAQV